MKKIALALMLACVVSPAFAAFDSFINFGDIKGESTDKDHKDWIEILSFNVGTATGGASGIASRGLARPMATLTAPMGKWLPAVQSVLVTGRHIPEVIVDVARQRYTLNDVVVSAVSMNGRDAVIKLTFNRYALSAAPAPTPAVVSPRLSAASMIRPRSPNAQVFVNDAPGERFTLLGLRRLGNSATLTVREPSNGFFAANKAKKNGKVSVKAEYFQITMNDCFISSAMPAPDGTETITLNFSRYDGPAEFRP